MAAKRKAAAKTKHCARCPRAGRKPERPLAEFPRNKATADGLGAYCRACKRDADRDRLRGPRAAPVPPGPLPVPQHPPAAPVGVAQNSARTRAPALEITDELIDQAADLIREFGITRRAAARKCNVSENTFKGWLREAADLKDESDPRRRLLHAVEMAEGEAEFKATKAYWAGVMIDPQVAQRFLERRFSKGDEKWARTEHLTVSDGDAAPMEMIDARKLLADKLSKLLGAAPAATAEPNTGGGDPGRAAGGLAEGAPPDPVPDAAGAAPQ